MSEHSTPDLGAGCMVIVGGLVAVAYIKILVVILFLAIAALCEVVMFMGGRYAAQNSGNWTERTAAMLLMALFSASWGLFLYWFLNLPPQWNAIAIAVGSAAAPLGLGFGLELYKGKARKLSHA